MAKPQPQVRFEVPVHAEAVTCTTTVQAGGLPTCKKGQEECT
jgi:hypothetical protein